MARPPRFSTDRLLDAAVLLGAASGPAGVTMSAVAQETGAPSGSVYHRFPGRNALLAEVWLRTVERFQEGWLAAIDTEPDAHRAGRAAARHVVAWSRAHPQEAALLLYGAEDFGRSGWSAEHGARADLGGGRVRAALAALAAGLGADGPQDRERVALAVIDLPLSVVRRHLRAGQPLPAHAERLAEECATALLGQAAEPGADVPG
ncbi:TetR family transcriptional regulator [Streptomyces sp. KhCrAH-43]|uniref:TetR/AcrR family transcriptional regulator n=1 Tax=unclassified Streptomyces TaxID=2593676 RepID=UPI00036DBE95|nr:MULTISPECIES: TetR/AcrR family transcriptional regulator [unclassified Streptomyces]MYS35088.1 TetR family transcriptional regulator [Streptomyces sp. SID4920]MYX65135.1 TetR family transcriptional regulator [Streptomyces sp. SID8373]RAJ64898.1 TetR family transcriptional regulator [Streptomyces sp. KhCrAH-43]